MTVGDTETAPTRRRRPEAAGDPGLPGDHGPLRVRCGGQRADQPQGRARLSDPRRHSDHAGERGAPAARRAMTAVDGFPKSVPDEGHYECRGAPWPSELRLYKERGPARDRLRRRQRLSPAGRVSARREPLGRGAGPRRSASKKIVSGRRHVKIGRSSRSATTPSASCSTTSTTPASTAGPTCASSATPTPSAGPPIRPRCCSAASSRDP